MGSYPRQSVPTVTVGSRKSSVEGAGIEEIRELLYIALCGILSRSGVYIGARTTTGGYKVKLYGNSATYEGYLSGGQHITADTDEFVDAACEKQIAAGGLKLMALLFDRAGVEAAEVLRAVPTIASKK